MRPTVHALSPAKLNLALSVGRPQASGMHPISSWMVTVDLHDELTVEALEPESLSLYAIVWHADAKRRSEIDWSITKDFRTPRPWFLAGGLDPWNVAEGLATSGAPMADVSSGVERGPGLKDASLISAFLDAVRRARQ
jgi:phosphoribosylanthranilate isomerase